jgi:hypothetical protein
MNGQGKFSLVAEIPIPNKTKSNARMDEKVQMNLHHGKKFTKGNVHK